MRAIAIVFLMLFAAAGLAQDQPVVSEEMRVQMVELDVKVTNVIGNTVKGLTVDDFTITENGRRQDLDSFEEIEIRDLVREEAIYYRPRIMLLIDFENTSFGNMKYVFPALRKLVNELDSPHAEVGLAVNAGGIQLLLDFTEDRAALESSFVLAEDLYRDVRNRWAFTYDGRDIFANRATDAATSAYLSNHYRNQLQKLRMFANFLGAYSGAKNVIIISDAWQEFGSQTAFTSGIESGYYIQSENLTDLKEIQSASLFNKVTLNVVNTRRTGAPAPGGTALPSGERLGLQEELAALTGGFHYQPNSKGLTSMIDRVVEKNEHFYRIRYYSSSRSEKFRNVKVRVRGMGRHAYTMGGYYAGAQKIRNGDADLETEQPAPRQIAVDMNTEWLTWLPITLRKYRAYLAVSQRAYDAQGQLVAEKVTTTQLTKKGRHSRAPFKGTLAFEVPNRDVVRLEAVIIDMLTGERVVISSDADSSKI